MSAEEDDLLAAEYALGLLEPQAAAAAERRAAGDRDFAARVAGWRDRLIELDRTATPAEPSADLWPRIERALDAASARPAIETAGPDLLTRLWRSLGLWRGIGIGATVAACAALLLLAQPSPPPLLVAVLQAPDGTQAGAIVEVRADGSIELIPLVDMQVPPGRALQVWTLWDRERGPVPMGLLPRAQRAQFGVPGLPPPRPDQLYEITLEPATGSPTGRPTGPILYKGLASRPL